MANSEYSESVFINCPFDTDYVDMLDALVFAVHDCGFVARCALEVEDASESRLTKSARLSRSAAPPALIRRDLPSWTIPQLWWNGFDFILYRNLLRPDIRI